jgi:hypothetical protein
VARSKGRRGNLRCRRNRRLEVAVFADSDEESCRSRCVSSRGTKREEKRGSGAFYSRSWLGEWARVSARGRDRTVAEESHAGGGDCAGGGR